MAHLIYLSISFATGDLFPGVPSLSQEAIRSLGTPSLSQEGSTPWGIPHLKVMWSHEGSTLGPGPSCESMIDFTSRGPILGGDPLWEGTPPYLSV